MKTVADMTLDEVLAESRRRDARRASGLPLSETPAEAEERIAEDDDRLEKLIQRDVVKLYRAHGCTVRNLSQARKSKQAPGLADLYVCRIEVEGRRNPNLRGYGPKAWWHETKTPTGVQSPAQRDFQRDNEACGIAYVLGGVAAAESKLRQIGAMA